MLPLAEELVVGLMNSSGNSSFSSLNAGFCLIPVKAASIVLHTVKSVDNTMLSMEI